MVHRIILLLLILCSINTTANAATIQLPQTGQTACYDAAGVVIACADSGQDGDKLTGAAWPSPRFIVNMKGDGVTPDGTVTDNLTGLIWLKDANCTDTSGGVSKVDGYQAWPDALTWSNTLASGACGLDDGSVASDWRLPNIVELKSLVDLSRSSPALPDGYPFGNVQLSPIVWYWSSSTFASSNAWYVDMDDGFVNYLFKKDSFHNDSIGYVWPVRGGHAATVQLPRTGQTGCWDLDGNAVTCATDPLANGQDGKLQKGTAWPTPRFVGLGNGTIRDDLTGLVWLSNANCFGTQTWTSSLIEASTLVGDNSKCGLYDGSVAGNWRLPNRNELLSLVNFQEDIVVNWLNGQGFDETQVEYWTSDSYSPNLPFKWTVDLLSGYTDFWNAVDTYALLPVRDFIATIGVTPAGNDFGSVTINTTSASQTFTLTNTGLDPLVVSSITITGGDSGMFTLTRGDGTGGTCGDSPTIDPAGSCTVFATFTPISTGAKSTELRISSNDPATPNKDVALTGTGALPTYNVSTAVVGGNGDVACDSPVNEGDDSVCIITPDNGYHLATLTDDSVDKLGTVVGDRYAITNVQAAHAIQVTFGNSYTVTYDGNGNSGGSVPGDAGSYANGATVTVLGSGTLTKSGYSFSGWNTAANGSGTSQASASTFAMGSANVTLYAKWTPNSYTVSFTSNGGSVVTSQIVAYDTTATAPTAPTRNGYTFAGWYIDAGLTTAFAFSTAITGDTTLYAKWTANAPITYQVTPSVGNGSSVTPATAQSVSSGATTGFTIAPVAGYGILAVTGCNGTLSGNTYTTGAITGDCSIVVNAVKHNGNGGNTSAPTIVDAQKALQAFVGNVQLTPAENIRYDVAPLAADGVPLGNSVVDIADVIMILRRSVGIGSW